MKLVGWRARQLLSAGLLFIFVTACAAEAMPSPVPSATQAPSATPAASPTLQPTATRTPRREIETYAVQPGDTVEGIAAEFGLQPETVLWANYDLLLDIADLLFPDMQLSILPVDGVYHQVGGGDTVNNIAVFFGASAQDILAWPGNNLDAAGNIQPGQWLMVPGGRLLPRRRSLPNLPRYAMAVDFLEFGSGACPLDAGAGAVGDGIYAWPVSGRQLAGDGFWGAHPAADLAAMDGEPVLAADDGVVTFSGWSNFGYGYTVMLDHGNGQFSLYAGLGEALALCGASVAEGEVIGTVGITGHPAGPYLHFEIRSGQEALNPLDLLP